MAGVAEAIAGIVGGVADIFESSSKENRQISKSGASRSWARSIGGIIALSPVLIILIVLLIKKKDNG